jgi:hypothetical protein
MIVITLGDFDSQQRLQGAQLRAIGENCRTNERDLGPKPFQLGIVRCALGPRASGNKEGMAAKHCGACTPET